jgi:hypothetical protein
VWICESTSFPNWASLFLLLSCSFSTRNVLISYDSVQANNTPALAASNESHTQHATVEPKPNIPQVMGFFLMFVLHNAGQVVSDPAPTANQVQPAKNGTNTNSKTVSISKDSSLA